MMFFVAVLILVISTTFPVYGQFCELKEQGQMWEIKFDNVATTVCFNPDNNTPKEFGFYQKRTDKDNNDYYEFLLVKITETLVAERNFNPRSPFPDKYIILKISIDFQVHDEILNFAALKEEVDNWDTMEFVAGESLPPGRLPIYKLPIGWGIGCFSWFFKYTNGNIIVSSKSGSPFYHEHPNHTPPPVIKFGEGHSPNKKPGKKEIKI